MEAHLKKTVYHKTPHNSGFAKSGSRKLTLGRLVAVNTMRVQSIPCWKKVNGVLTFLGYKYIYHRNYTV